MQSTIIILAKCCTTVCSSELNISWLDVGQKFKQVLAAIKPKYYNQDIISFEIQIQSKRHMCTLYDSIYIVIDRAIRSD